MEDRISEILSHREKRYEKIKFLKMHYKAVITVKSNIPGNHKNIPESFILINLFKDVIPDKYIDKIELDQGADGPCYLIGSNYNPKTIKSETIHIENTHFLGRFIDLDVFDEEKSLSRQKMRKCYLCDDFAYVCIRNRRHTLGEILSFIIDNVYIFFENKVKNYVDESILAELNLHPKFGLVTPITNGSHSDMSYDLMVNAKDSIIPYLLQMFKIGWTRDLENIFEEIRKIGIEAEKKMYATTDNVNAYKGLIFNFGILISAYGYLIKNNMELFRMFDLVKSISQNVLDDFKKESKTFGYFAYKEYNILGARGEVYNGLPTVKKAMRYIIDFSDESKLKTLMFLISQTDDTVLLKRCKSIEKYKKIKELFDKNINSSANTINDINQNCIEENLSFGGSADLLILTVFLKKIGL